LALSRLCSAATHQVAPCGAALLAVSCLRLNHETLRPPSHVRLDDADRVDEFLG
jgi:hypothetical protein